MWRLCKTGLLDRGVKLSVGRVGSFSKTHSAIFMVGSAFSLRRSSKPNLFIVVLLPLLFAVGLLGFIMYYAGNC